MASVTSCELLIVQADLEILAPAVSVVAGKVQTLTCTGTTIPSGQHNAGRGTGVDKMSKVFNFWEKQRTQKRISFGQ